MKHYFITGSSKGIGKALVEVLLTDPDVTVTGISRSNNFHHPAFRHIQIDLSDGDALIRQAGELFTLTGNAPDEIILINNAGYLGAIKYLGEVDDDDYRKIFNINITAVAVLMNAFIRIFKGIPARKVIINISSGAGKFPYDGWSGYCTSKAAVDMLSRVAALENEKRGRDIKIISLAPGIIETNMQKKIRQSDERNFSRVEKFHDMKNNGELLSPDEAAIKILRIIGNIESLDEVVVDLRN